MKISPKTVSEQWRHHSPGACERLTVLNWRSSSIHLCHNITPSFETASNCSEVMEIVRYRDKGIRNCTSQRNSA